MTRSVDPSAVAQQQFLDVVSKEEAMRRWREACRPRRLAGENVPLDAALGRVLSEAVTSPIDVPPFDRALVDGFAVRAADTLLASDSQPRTLSLNRQALACGDEPGPESAVSQASATLIATGAMLPRGADAVVMVEHSRPEGTGVAITQAMRAGQGIAFAGSDMARGETILWPGTVIGAREIGLLAACGIADVSVVRRPRIAVISTGDELVAPGGRLDPGAIYDSNSAILAATVREHGGEAISFGVIRDDVKALKEAMLQAVADCDVVVLSGGTSKGNGDITHRMVAELGEPGIVVHGVALKPGKPLCLAVARGKPIAILPGFPTSAIVIFRTFVVPLIRALAGLPDERAETVEAVTSTAILSEIGRSEFAMVSLVASHDGLKAVATGKGSGAVTSFSQADGFVEIAPLADRVDAGARVTVNLIAGRDRLPDLTIAGSQCIGLNPLTLHLVQQGINPRLLALGSQAGLAMAKRRECDIAPIHLLDTASGRYNTPFLDASLELVPGWLRMQGLAFRAGDKRFEGNDPRTAIAAAAINDSVIMVNRNPGAGTRALIDELLAGARPSGYANQPRSHNAVAAAIAQGRADWGITIAPVAAVYGLSFAPLAEEHYDFAIVSAKLERPVMQAFRAALAEGRVRAELIALGFRPK